MKGLSDLGLSASCAQSVIVITFLAVLSRSVVQSFSRLVVQLVSHSASHSPTQLPSRPVTQSPSHPVTQSPSLSVTQSSSLPVTPSPSLQITQSPMRSCIHLIRVQKKWRIVLAIYSHMGTSLGYCDGSQNWESTSTLDNSTYLECAVCLRSVNARKMQKMKIALASVELTISERCL